MLSLAIGVPFYIYIASAFRPYIPVYLNLLLVTIVIALALLECYLAFSVSQKLRDTTSKKVVFSIIVFIMVFIGYFMASSLLRMFSYPDKKDCYIVALPVKGRWRASHAGGAEVVNYHNAYKSQAYAIDIMKLSEDGKLYKNRGGAIEDFYTLGENIYSPVNGVVVTMVDSLENMKVSFAPNEKKNPAGNHVAIRFAGNRYVFLAHLGKGSIRVKTGDTVKAGDLVGRAGNSGNTSWPHLHMHIQDQPGINRHATAYPFRFDTMVRKRWFSWRTVIEGFLIRNDLFSDK
jgi:hypothetical protein